MNPGVSGDEPIRIREIWPPGTSIKGDYVIEKKLGSGGFGSVYLARHRFLGSIHVIKRLHEQYASDPEYVRKFLNEGRAVRRLKGCPHVVEVEHMTQSEDGHLILVMEFVAGGDLAALMETRTLSVHEVIESGRQIALGLDAAHRAGLIHRDIKPQNILIGHDSSGKPVLKLIDFGLAKDHANQEKTSVMRGGSVGYTAPEQWMRAGKHIDGRADLYSLGATMYRLLCGRMPFETGGDIGAWLERVEQGAPTAPRLLRTDCPKALSNLILELLSAGPDGRPSDAATVVKRLEAIGTATPPSVYPAPEISKLMPPAPAAPTTRQGLWTGIGIAAALALGVAGWIASQQSRGAGETGPANIATEIPRAPEQKKKTDQPKVAATEATKETPPGPLEQPIDHAALGDAARNAGDLDGALRHYRQAGDAQRLAALQRAVEGDIDERVSALMDRGQFAEALKLLNRWLAEFPRSQRLLLLSARTVKARDSQ
jgi:serine/threonine-protein kinase